jgi:hypothetical protein
MRKLLKTVATLAFLLSLALPSFAQQPLQQAFTENIALAPAAIVSGQTGSTTTGTGAVTSLTGGAIAAGSYRISVTCFSATNTETPQSVDTAATSVVTTTGTTSTLTIFPPICTGTGNEIGWRMGVSASGGATATETLQTITAAICTLSASSTPSCSLNSPAIFTASTNFSAGSGIGPATPGTLIYPPIANQASQALFENAQYKSRIVSWTVTGTAPSACTFNIQTGATVAALANVGQTITCTASGSYALPLATAANLVSINVATYTAGDTTTVTTFNLYDLPYVQPIYWGNAAPTSACAAPMGVYFLTGANSNMYTCVTTTWTAITLP